MPGSHKANLTCPPNMARSEQYQDFVQELHGKAGDALVSFSLSRFFRGSSRQQIISTFAHPSSPRLSDPGHMRCRQIFCEACTHGTLPWMGEHQRRAVLYKYNAGHMSWGGGGLPLHGEHIHSPAHNHVTDGVPRWVAFSPRRPVRCRRAPGVLR